MEALTYLLVLTLTAAFIEFCLGVLFGHASEWEWQSAFWLFVFASAYVGFYFMVSVTDELKIPLFEARRMHGILVSVLGSCGFICWYAGTLVGRGLKNLKELHKTQVGKAAPCAKPATIVPLAGEVHSGGGGATMGD